jgi:hypothetical protein
MPAALLATLLLSAPARADLDVAFVLDTTGSMGGELNEAKRRVTQISEALRAARPQETVRIGVVAFRDRGDAYVTQVDPFEADVRETEAFLAGLSSGGGGDGPEDVLSGMEAALHQLQWADGADKQVFLIGDAPPHLDYSGHHDPAALLSEASDRGIVFHTIGCRSLPMAGVTFFRSVAYATEGSYQHIGRVRTDQGGLAEAIVETLVDTPDEGPREPLGAVPERDRRQPPADSLADQGLLVRLGTWWDAEDRLPVEGATCTLTVLMPDGVGLDREPVFETSAAGLHATLPLTASDDRARARTFELSRCLDVETPVLVAFSN